MNPPGRARRPGKGSVAVSGRRTSSTFNCSSITVKITTSTVVSGRSNSGSDARAVGFFVAMLDISCLSCTIQPNKGCTVQLNKELQMLGIQFIKSQPTTHLMQFRGGKLVRQGAGLSFFYYAPTTSLVAVPVASRDAGFMLELVTSDFQGVTVQGEVTYRVGDPSRIYKMMDFSLKPDGASYASEDPDRLQGRVVMQVRAIVQQVIQALPLRNALKATAEIARAAQAQLGNQPEVQALGLEILGVSVVAIKPTPDIARALEAEAREANLKAADDAISQRRMAGVQNERAIRQN
eukprot:Opistho-1_new@3797